MDNSGLMAARWCPDVRWVPSLAALLAVTALPVPALACFFYEEPEDLSVVTQSALEVLLVEQGGNTTMIVGAHAEANVQDMGWIVAVPNLPAITTAPEMTFSALDFATRPIFRTSSGGGSASAADAGGAGCGGATRAGSDFEADERWPEVTVWNSTVVGPYDVRTISAASTADLQEWVESNGFPWRPETEPAFSRYIDDDFFFVVAKVRPAQGAAGLVPLAVTYPSRGGELVVPVLLSRMQATEDMGLLVWIIADQPARPSNWTQVALPEQQILVDDEAETTNYADLVAASVEAAGGQGFVTEYVQAAAVTALAINDEPTRELVGTTGWVTRLYTRIDPVGPLALEDPAPVDPTFVLDETIAPIAQLHDLTLVEDSPYWGGALRPVFGFAPVALVLLTRLRRRRAVARRAG